MPPEDREALIGSMLTTPSERPVADNGFIVDLPGTEQLWVRIEAGEPKVDHRVSPWDTWYPSTDHKARVAP